MLHAKCVLNMFFTLINVDNVGKMQCLMYLLTDKKTNTDSKMKRINITVPEDLLEEFKKYCETQCRPVSSQIQFMMRQVLKESQKENPEETVSA